jgi:hypothetical protein
MKIPFRGRGLTVVAFAVAAAAAAAEFHYTFDAQSPGAPPVFFRFEATGGLAPDTWKVIPNGKSASSFNVLIQTAADGSPDQYRLALSSEAGSFQDGSSQVALIALKRNGGPPAGLVLRFAGPGDFVAALYEPSSRRVRILRFAKGKATELARAVVPPDPLVRPYPRFGFSAKGPDLSATLWDKAILAARDPDPRPGQAGVISAAGVVQGFDDLDIRTP